MLPCYSCWQCVPTESGKDIYSSHSGWGGRWSGIQRKISIHLTQGGEGVGAGYRERYLFISLRVGRALERDTEKDIYSSHSGWGGRWSGIQRKISIHLTQGGEGVGAGYRERYLFISLRVGRALGRDTEKVGYTRIYFTRSPPTPIPRHPHPPLFFSVFVK